MCSRSSGNFCVTDLSFSWLHAVRSQTVAVMAVPTMAAEDVSSLQGTAVSAGVVGSPMSSVNRPG